MSARDLIIGSGGGKKKKSRVAQEAPDNLRSTQYAEIVDLLCEGEIEGLVDGAKSIFLDETPLQNPDGTYNFDSFNWSLVPGTQEQGALPGLREPGAEIGVATEVKFNNPVTRQVSNPEIDAVRVTISFPALTHQNTSNGDLNGTSVQIAIDVQVDGGGFVQKVIDTITGKTTSGYQRSYYIRLPVGSARDVRVRRLTADSTTVALQNQTIWSTYTEVIETSLRYPNSALVGIRIDAEQFSGIPTRGYDVKLLKVRVPSNYDPTTRTYSGIWNGSWSAPVWTDNPAWCWYDLVTEERYGLGSFIDAAVIDKWELYEIARYCDELVPDGFGGFEPRFTLNIYLQTREEALKVVQQLAAVFRSMVFASTAGIMVTQDRPTDPAKQFTVANVVDGLFTYQGTARNTRHTVALVAWNDPEDMFRQKVEYVEDPDSIAKFGVRETEVVALGCTSRGQAHRLGKYILYSEQYETETVTFRTGLEGLGIAPGDIIQTSDSARSGERMGGRILAASTSQVTIDAPLTMKPGRTYKLHVILPTGALEERGVIFNGVEQTVTTLNLTAPLSIAPQVMAMWIVEASDVLPEWWKVMGITEVEPHIVEVTALYHHPDKFAAIDYGTKLQPRPSSTIKFKQSPVTNVTARTTTYQVNPTTFSTRIIVSWTAPLEGASYYIVQYRRGSDNWKTLETSSPSIDIDNVLDGAYEIAVIAVNSIGRQSVPALITHTVDTESEAVASITGLRLTAPFVGDDVSFEWDPFPGAQHFEVEIWAGAALRLATTTLTPNFTYTFLQNSQNGGPFRTIEIRVKARTLLGSSTIAQTLSATNPQIGTAIVGTLDTSSGVQVSTNVPAELDWRGTMIWVETTSSFDPLSTTPKYNGPNNVYQHDGIDAGDYYVRAAHYDKFGPDSLNISSPMLVHVTKMAAGVEKVLDASQITAVPGSPPPGGDSFWAVYSTHDMKMWRWNTDLGLYESSVDGNDILANTIVANKLAIAELSSISANLGNATAGTFTLSNNGFIRGGATSWTAGKGIWQGFDTDTYKWRVGTPGSSGASWDGNKFTIYGPDGSITLESGTSLATIDDYARQQAAEALSVAATAESTANNANTQVSNIVLDSKFTPNEKVAIRREWDSISAERAGINSQAQTYSIGLEQSAYDSAFQGLANYLNNGVTWSSGVPSWINDANLGTTTDIVGATFRSTFTTYYNARQTLLNKISDEAGKRATWFGGISGRPSDDALLNSRLRARSNWVRGFATWTLGAGCWIWVGNPEAEDKRGLVIPSGVNLVASASPGMSLMESTTWTVSFRAHCDTGGRTLHLDLFPDTLPQNSIVLPAGWSTQSLVWTTSHTDRGNCQLRFFADTEPGQIVIGDVKLEAGAERSVWIPHERDSVGINNPVTPSNASTFIADAWIGQAIVDGALKSSAYVPGSSGWRIGKDGSAEFRNVTVRGDIEATSLKADTANIVQTLHVAGNAVTVPQHAQFVDAVNQTAWYPGNTESRIISVSDYIDTGGNPVIVSFSGQLTYSIQEVPINYAGVVVIVNGVIYEWRAHNSGTVLSMYGSTSFTTKLNLPAGNCLVQIGFAIYPWGSGATVNHQATPRRTLTLLGCKR